jgi:hypothetical protein
VKAAIGRQLGRVGFQLMRLGERWQTPVGAPALITTPATADQARLIVQLMTKDPAIGLVVLGERGGAASFSTTKGGTV